MADNLTAETGYLLAALVAATETPEAFDLAVLLPRIRRAVNALDTLLVHHSRTDRGRVLPCCEGCESDCEGTPSCCTAWLDCPVRTLVVAALFPAEVTP